MDPFAPPTPMAPPMPEEPPLEEPLQIGPTPPLGYRRPKKPKLEEVLAIARKDAEDHRLRVETAQDAVLRLAMATQPGHFKADIPAIEEGRVVLFPDNALSAEHDLGVTHVGGMEIGYDAVFRDPIDREEASAKEALLHYLDENARRQHALAGGGDLRFRTVDWAMKYGLLVGFDGVDPINEACGLRMVLVDPGTCFPTWEGSRGLSRLTRVYRATAAQVLGSFGDPDGKVERKLAKMAKAEDGRYDAGFEGEVVEWWDRHWLLVAFNDEEILITEHKYTRVPFVAAVAPWGDDGSIEVARAETGSAGEIRYLGEARRREELARKCRPFLAKRFAAHDTHEALLGRLLTEFKNGPRVALQQDVLAQGQGVPDLERHDEGFAAALGAGETPVPLPPTPPQLVTALLAADAANRMTAGAPGSLFGQSPGAQTAGSAVEVLNAAGLERFVPVVRFVEAFEAARAEHRLELLRDWGPILGPDDDRGTLTVPGRLNPRTGRATAHEVTPELLRRTGIRVEVRLHKPGAPNPGLANTVIMLKGAGILSDEKALGWLNEPRPDEEIERIREDALAKVPEVAQAETLERLWRRVQEAIARGDMESAKVAADRARFVAEQIAIAQEAKARRGMMGPGMGMPPGMPAGMVPPGMADALPPGMAAPGGMADGPIGYQGASLPEFGIATGTEGGRPPGPAGPLPGM